MASSTSKGCKTRGACGGLLSEVVGAGKDFLPSDAPTVRAVLQRGILIQNEKIHQDVPKHLFPVSEMAKELAALVLKQWQKSNIQFQPPVTFQPKSIADRISKIWMEYKYLYKLNPSEREEKNRMLDTLFDILTCKHEIHTFTM